MYDVVIIGNGLIGSAAARYLSKWGFQTAVIGPTEPANWSTHQSVFASHYDQGRITRRLDPDQTWAALAQQAIAAYEEIELQSGIHFHFPTGGLRVAGAPLHPLAKVVETNLVARELNIPFLSYTEPMWQEEHPYFFFPTGSAVLHEASPAGYINPRDLVAAQTMCAQQQGATIIPETAVSLQMQHSYHRVTTQTGQAVRGKNILLSTGAFTNMLLHKKIDLRPTARTILLAEIDESEQKRLAGMPTLIYHFATDANLSIDTIYLLPPIRYPDGKIYLKIGGYPKNPVEFGTDIAAITPWFHGDGSDQEFEGLKQCLHHIMPNLQITAYDRKPCVLTYTAHDHPYIDKLSDGLFVAAGGSGSAAKSSNEIGRLAASLVRHGHWQEELPAGKFTAVYL